MRTDIGFLFGRKAEHTHFGLKGSCSGMYFGGGYKYYVYGIKGIINFIIDKRWGNMAVGKRRF